MCKFFTRWQSRHYVLGSYPPDPKDSKVKCAKFLFATQTLELRPGPNAAAKIPAEDPAVGDLLQNVVRLNVRVADIRSSARLLGAVTEHSGSGRISRIAVD